MVSIDTLTAVVAAVGVALACEEFALSPLLFSAETT
jgi:hypothetical protein